MKPGYMTTEFWVTVGTTLWGIFGHTLPAWAQGAVTTIVPAAYTIGRAVVKAAEAKKAAGPGVLQPAETMLGR